MTENNSQQNTGRPAEMEKTAVETWSAAEFLEHTWNSEEEYIAVMRGMTAWQKVAIMAELSRRQREKDLSEIRQQHPDADERECRLRLAVRYYGPELIRKAFGWASEEENCAVETL